MKKAVYLFIISTIFLLGCTTSMKQEHLAGTVGVKLQKNKTIYIAKVNDGAFEGKVYYGSGMNVTNMFAVNISPYAKSVSTGSDAGNYLYEAKRYNADYAVTPTILHWEPRAAAWSGIPTQLSINVRVYDMAAGREVINKNLDVTGRSFTFANQSVEKLANIIIRQFTEDTFR